jgi:hypothetical protein
MLNVHKTHIKHRKCLGLVWAWYALCLCFVLVKMKKGQQQVAYIPE